MAEKENTQQHGDEPKDTGSVLDEAVVEDVKIEPSKAQATVDEKPQVVKKGGNGLVWVSLLLSLLSLGALAGAYWLYMQQQTQQQQNLQQWQATQTTNMQNETVAMQEVVQSLKDQLSGQQNQFLTAQNQSTDTLRNEVMQRLDAMEVVLMDNSSRKSDDKTLPEVEYLVRLAGRKLWLENDKASAESLLKRADKLISAADDASLVLLQNAINKDITIIEALPDARINEYYAKLSGVLEIVDNLPIKMHEFQNERSDVEQTSTTAAAEPGMWQNFVNTLKEAKYLFELDYGSTKGDFKPLIMKNRQWMLKSQLKLAIMQAQMAALEREQTVFKDAVSRAVKLLADFKQMDNGVKTALKKLNELYSEPVAVNYPNTLKSQDVLDNLMRARLGENTTGNTPEDQGEQP